MLVELPGRGTVDASDEHAKLLLAAGWRPVVPDAAKPAPKRRARKAGTTKKSE